MDNQTPSKAIMKNSLTTEFLESLSCFGLAAAFLLQAVAAQGMPVPLPPKADIVGQPGGRTVCYWVYAESAEKANAGEFPGKITDLSAPCVVRNAPDHLDSNNKVRLTITPLAGA